MRASTIKNVDMFISLVTTHFSVDLGVFSRHKVKGSS